MKSHALSRGEIIATVEIDQPACIIIIALFKCVNCLKMFLRRAIWPMGFLLKILFLRQIGFTAALPELLMTIVTISGGVFIDKLIKHNVVSTTHGRKLAQCMGT